MTELVYAAGIVLLRFAIGFAMVAVLPIYPVLILVLLFMTHAPDLNAIGAWQTDCVSRERTEAASPNGRLSAISVRIACTDPTDAMHDQSQIFVTATRLDRSAHLLTLERSGPKPAALHWKDNQTIVVTKSSGATQTYTLSWCGISTELQADPSP